MNRLACNQPHFKLDLIFNTLIINDYILQYLINLNNNVKPQPKQESKVKIKYPRSLCVGMYTLNTVKICTIVNVVLKIVDCVTNS